MDKNTGGAKPKISTGTNSNNSSSRNGSSSSSNGSQTTGAHSRNRSPRRESTNTARSSVGGPSGLPSNRGNRHTSSRHAGESTTRRGSVPNSVARRRNSSSTNETQNSTAPQSSVSEHSPPQGSNSEKRTPPRQNGRSTFSRPVLHQRNGSLRPMEPPFPSSESPTNELPHLPPLPGIASSAEDSELSRSLSPTEMTEPQEAARSLEQLAALRPRTGRPMSSSQDAAIARELLQAEMDMMLQRDEEMARQLQDELNDGVPSPLEYPMSMFVPGGLQARGRHFPSIPGRMEGGRGARGTNHRSLRALRLFRGPDGAIRMGFEVPGRSGGLRVLMRAGGQGRGRGRRMAGREPEDGSGAEPGSSSPDVEDILPAGEFDPDERLLADESDAPDNFLSMMNDPSLMLLMLLLRAPERLYENEGGVDLSDYEGLWELAERLGEVRRRGISEEQINHLPTHKFKTHSSEAAAGKAQCQICLVDFENGDCLRSIPCKHDFHRDCIDRWLKRNATCPICRQSVKPNNA